MLNTFGHSIISSIVDVVLPNLCSLCGRSVLHKHLSLCPPCLKEIRFINDPICPVCGLPFDSKEVENHSCPGCEKKKVYFHKARGVGRYQGSLLEAIRLFKYRGKTNLAKTLGAMLARYPIDFSLYHLIVPVPLHVKRLRERGFNQALILSREIERSHSLRIDIFNLKRVRYTRSQVELNEKERIQNIMGAFMVKDPGVFKGLRILLIDDIFTTGATVNECAKVLRKAGVERVDALTLAKVV